MSLLGIANHVRYLINSLGSCYQRVSNESLNLSVLLEQEPHEGSCYSLLGCGFVHVLGVGQAGLAVVPVHEDRLHVVEDQATLGGIGGRMLALE